jgi:CRISPR-associated helicase, Cas3 family
MTVDRQVDTGSGLLERLGVFLASLTPQAKSLWAKSGDETGWLSLPQHLADCAGVAATLWDDWLAQSVKQRLIELTGLKEKKFGT